jgi:DNA-binding GntR family transcriptional regulator
MALVRPSRQNITIAIINRLQVMSERYVRKHLEPIGRDVRASEEHRQMLEAWLVGGDIAGLARDHLGTTLAELRGQLAAEG